MESACHPRAIPPWAGRPRTARRLGDDGRVRAQRTGVTALNGGPVFQFNEAVSLQILCDTQAEIDHYWAKLSQGGDEKAQACGWLKDRYGVSWQVAPKGMARMMKDPKSPATERVFAAMMKMRKLDIAELRAAYKGKS